MRHVFRFAPGRYRPAPSIPGRTRRRQEPAAGVGFRIDPLEPRTLLAFAPVGPEFRVNTTTAEDQLAASVAVDADGDFIVAWESVGEYFSKGIYAQRYNAAGLAQGAQFRVDPADNNWDFYPSVACDAEGNFVVAWENRSGVGWGIYARRYNAAGVAQGGEFPVKKSTTAGDQHPSVASDADGDFVVAWENFEEDGFRWGVFARRYDAAGVPRGGEFLVNTSTDWDQRDPSVASAANGDFVVAWESDSFDPSTRNDVFAQRYSAAGVAQGGEFRVNTFTAGDQRNPSVASDADGDFVVAWGSRDQDGFGYGVYAQRYDSADVPQGGEFRVNTTTAGFYPSVASDAEGDVVVAWEGVYAHRYNAAGVAQGGEFRVNTLTVGGGQTSVASDAEGDFVVTWSSHDQDGSGYGVYAQRYAAVPTAAPEVTQVFVNGPGLTGQTNANGTAFRALGGIDNTNGYPVPAGANQTRSIPWNGGVDRIGLRFSIDVASELQQDDLVIRGVNAATYPVTGFAYDAANRTGVWTLGSAITNDKVRLFLDDARVGGLDGEWADGADGFPSGDGTAGGDFSFRFNVLRGDVNQDGRVNALDLSFIKQRLNKFASDPGVVAPYSPFADLTADGLINAVDLSAARARLNNVLPTAEPATALLFGTARISA